MHPILVDFGTWDLPWLGPTPIFLPTYGLLFATGALLAWWWLQRRAASLGLPAEPVFNLCFYTLLAGIAGAKLALVVVDFDYYLRDPAALLGTIRTAGVLIGGVACGVIVFILYARRHGLPALVLADAGVAPLALAQAIGRLGCFAAGCCWGVPTSGWCSVTFTDPAANAQTGVPLHEPRLPVQLFQAGTDLALAGVLTLLWRRRLRPAGTVFWAYAVLYGFERSVIEIWRGDASRGLWLGGAVSTSQILGGIGVAVGLVMLARGALARRRAEDG